MRILFRDGDELICAKISMCIYNQEEQNLWLSIDDSTILKSEININGVPKELARDIMKDLYTTGLYDFSSLSLDIEYC